MPDNPLIGTWRLVSFDVKDEEGRVTYPFGQDAVGFISYMADGQMAVQFGRANRTKLSGGDWVGGPPDEIAVAAR
ncbi:MAG TPA: lipocalin-like domain-containing protein, partial [Thermomicrobiales bacterium]|nr:lipocalin-like domain-containing protein [Thermomicrobiales bacterium]